MPSYPLAEPFAVAAVVDLIVVLCAAAIRTTVCRNKPLAFHALAVWGIVVVVADAGNEFGGRSRVVLALVLGTMALVLWLARVSWKPRALWQGIRAQQRDLALVFAVLALQVGLYLVPLAVFPPHTLVTGNLICNDSVVHGVLMRGFDVVHGAYARWPYLAVYPDGFHAVVYALTAFFGNADAPFLLLPMSVWSASFLGLAVLMLLAEDGQPSDAVALIIAASPAAAFLLGTSVYLYFIGHMAALPFILGGVVIVTTWSSEDLRGAGLLLAAAPIAAAAATYGLFSLTLIAFAAALRLAPALSNPTRLWASGRAAFRVCFERDALLGLALVLVVAVPVIRQIVAGFWFFVAMTPSPGNLSGGFLSPFHATGFWSGGVEYRSPLTGADSPVTMILAGIFVVQALLIGHARLSRGTVFTLLAFATPVLASAVFVRSSYVNFKYLCFFTALWVPVALLGLSRVLGRLTGGHRAPVLVAVAAVVVTMVVGPLQSFKLMTVLPEHWFQTMAAIRTEHLSQGPVLVLTREDWFAYYRDADEVMPLTGYLAQAYMGQAMREVLIDAGYQQDAVAWLDHTLPGASARLDGCTSTLIGGRFRLYQFSCLSGTP